MHVRATLAAALVGLIASGCTSGGAGRQMEQGPPPGGPAARPAESVGAGLPAPATLPDMLKHAALHSPQLKAAFHRWQAALARVPQARALPDPQFTYRYFIEEVETRVGAQRQSFELSQMFPWPGTLGLRGRAAAAAAEAARHEVEAARLELAYQVQDAYYERYYLARAVAVTRENIRLVELLEAVARARYKTAAAAHPDVIRAQVELGRLSDRLAELEDLRGPVAARLNAALNRPPSAPLGDPPARIEAEPVALTESQCLTWLAEGNPQLRAMDSEVERRCRQVELARKGYFPDVKVGATFIDVAPSTGGRGPSDDGKDAVIAAVSVNLPVWRDKLDAAVRQARQRHLAAVMARQARLRSLEAELKLALHRFRDAGRKVGLYRDTLGPKARQSFQTTQAAYRAGKAAFTDLMDAQRLLLEFELSGQRALTDRARHLARLEALLGRQIPRPDRKIPTTAPNN